MPSNKKTRARLAKQKKVARKEALKTSYWMSLARGDALRRVPPLSFSCRIDCTHGCGSLPSDGSPSIVFQDSVVAFVNSIFVDDLNDSMPQFCKKSFVSFTDVWEDEDLKSNVANILIKMGVNQILLKRDEGERSKISVSDTFLLFLCDLIVVLEQHRPGANIRASLAKGMRKLYILEGGNERDILKFFSRRVNCDCLKEVYSAARRNLPKVGKCPGCDATFERNQLFECTGCKSRCYCSKECQETDYPNHVFECKEYRRWVVD